MATFPPPEPMTGARSRADEVRQGPRARQRLHPGGGGGRARGDLAPGRGGSATVTAAWGATASSCTRLQKAACRCASSTRMEPRSSCPVTACAAWLRWRCAPAGLPPRHTVFTVSGPRPVEVRATSGTRYAVATDLGPAILESDRIPVALDPPQPRVVDHPLVAGGPRGPCHRHFAREPPLRGVSRRSARRRAPGRARSRPGVPPVLPAQDERGVRRRHPARRDSRALLGARGGPDAVLGHRLGERRRGRHPEWPGRPKASRRLRRRHPRGGVAGRGPRPPGWARSRSCSKGSGWRRLPGPRAQRSVSTNPTVRNESRGMARSV